MSLLLSLYSVVEVSFALADGTAARAAAALGSQGFDRIGILPAALLAAEANHGERLAQFGIGPTLQARRGWN